MNPASSTGGMGSGRRKTRPINWERVSPDAAPGLQPCAQGAHGRKRITVVDVRYHGHGTNLLWLWPVHDGGQLRGCEIHLLKEMCMGQTRPSHNSLRLRHACAAPSPQPLRARASTAPTHTILPRVQGKQGLQGRGFSFGFT